MRQDPDQERCKESHGKADPEESVQITPSVLNESMSTAEQLLIGSSSALDSVRRAVERVAPTDSTVLILGETGTGKELVARAIHEKSCRRNAGFVPVSCVALAPDLITSELFGHEAGAFTGAVKRRVGRFEQASRGTLFLDEIGEMAADAQAMLLRVLQERVIERVGGGPVSVDVRIIAATNRDLLAEVKASRFRADLFYRLNVFPIRVPPLRDRKSDIPEIASHFVRQHAEKLARPVPAIRPSTFPMLLAHEWPGNVRELQNVMERAVIVTDGPELAFDPSWLVGMSVVETAKTWAAQEKQRILDALRASGGRVYGPGGAAHRLGLNPTTLYGKMRKHGIARDGSQWN
jgi:formate hydrogenlyase transcriptional activator